jgi:DNA invertase Pin-like site-specific DNA recombinase
MIKQISVGIYCRLSDEDRDKEFKEDDSQSIQNQKSFLIQYATNQNWSIYQIYSDDNYSGADNNRPEWNRLINDCEAGKVNLVLCKSQSRFSRDLEIVERYIHGKFAEWGVRFVSIVDNADTDIASNRKSRQINGLINEWYLEDVSNNVKNVLHHKARQGEFIGAFAPYGYMKDPEDKHHLIPDPEAAEVVKKIFNMYANGIGVINITRKLNEEGIIPPANHKAANSKYHNRSLTFDKKRQVWNPSSITRMLVNEIYIGNMVQCKHRNISYKNHKKVANPKDKWIIVPNTHEPLIDLETFNAAQAIKKSKHREGKFGSPSPLKIICARCGAPMKREHTTRNKEKCKYLRCATKHLSINCDNPAWIYLDVIENYILSEINKLIDRYCDKNLLKSIKEEETNKQITQLEKDIKKILQTIEGKKNVIYQIYNDKINGIITDEQFDDFNKRVKLEINKLQHKHNILQESRDNLSKETSEDIMFQKLSRYTHIKQLTPMIVSEFVEKVTIDVNENNEHIIQIYWTF